MRRRFALLLAAFAAILLASTLLSACGGSDDKGDDPVALLKETFTGDADIKSGRLTLDLDFDVKGLQGLADPIQLKLDGPFETVGENKLPKFDFDVRASTGGQPFDAGGISTGDKGFLSFAGQAFSIPDDTFAQFRQGFEDAQARSSRDAKDERQSLPLGVKPQDWLTDPKIVGDAEVGGAQTTHVRSGVDVDKLLTDLNRILDSAGRSGGQTITAAQRKQVRDAVQSAQVDVFSGKDDQSLRRMAVDLRLRKTAAVQGGRVRFAFQIAELNDAQDIKAPTGARPLSELLEQTGGAIPGIPGAAGGTSTTPGAAAPQQTTTPSAPGASSSGPDAKYLECVQKAGQDLDAVQACTKLLNG